MRAAALALAERGWRVLPCEERGKRPLTLRGSHDGTSDLSRVSEWWRRWPGANIGLATGADYFVVDTDGLLGAAWLEGVELPDTLTARTARGRHLFFRCPDGVTVLNSASKISLNVDIRGDGGLVVASPSIHPTGVRYEWLDVHDDAPSPGLMALAPGWLIDGVSDRSRRLIAVAGGERRAAAADAGKPGERFKIPARIRYGHRHEFCWRFTCSLLSQGVERRAIYRVVWSIMQRRADPTPPFSEADIRRIVDDTLCRYSSGRSRGFGGVR
jgi:putative DNA primase/helicase